jgi:hypothetical protein
MILSVLNENSPHIKYLSKEIIVILKDSSINLEIFISVFEIIKAKIFFNIFIFLDLKYFFL